MGMLESHEDMRTAGLALAVAVVGSGLVVVFMLLKDNGVKSPFSKTNRSIATHIVQRARHPPGRDEAPVEEAPVSEPKHQPGAYYPSEHEPALGGDASALPWAVAAVGGAGVFGVVGIGAFVMLGRRQEEPEVSEEEPPESPESSEPIQPERPTPQADG